MKSKVSSLVLLLAIVLYLPAVGFSAAPVKELRKTEYKKKIEHEFAVSPTDLFKVVNKYGKVDITTWEQPKVSIEVNITVNARSQESANEAFDRIHIEFDQGTGYSSAVTEIESQKSGWGSWWSGSSSDNFKINYTVKMPTDHSLDLSNKYGHSHITSFNGSGKFSVKYGDLFTQDVGGDIDLYLGYGNATMGNSKNVKAEIKYSKLNMQDVGDCTMNSKYSKLYLNSVKNFQVYSGYDNFDVGTAGHVDYEIKYTQFDFKELERMNGYSKYSNITVGTCHQGARMEMSYGGVKINELKPGFEAVDIQSNYASVKMHVHPDASYDFNASTKYAGIDYPSGLDIQRDIQSGSSKEVSGHRGSNGGKIKIATSYGGIKVW